MERKGKRVPLGANSITISAKKAENFKRPIRFRKYISLFWEGGRLQFSEGAEEIEKSLLNKT
jgi:hypothetical protein